MRAGPAVETMTISPCGDAYILAVHDFGNSRGFHDDDELFISIDPADDLEPIALRSPAGQPGSWWHVAKINMADRAIDLTNRVSGDMPTVEDGKPDQKPINPD